MTQLALILFCLTIALNSAAQLCRQWDQPRQVGQIDPIILKEASGISRSLAFPQRLYHINDSGDDAVLYTTDEKGYSLNAISINSKMPVDMEDLAVGPCGLQSCVFLGDIGDNKLKRDHIEILLVEEPKLFGRKISVRQTLHIEYPDGPHNAEAFFVTPLNGDIYLFTKEWDTKNGNAYPSKVYFLAGTKYNHLPKSSLLMFKYIGSLDLPRLAEQDGFLGQVVTAADIHPNGKTFILSTYVSLFEFDIEVLKKLNQSRSWIEGKDYRLIPLFTDLPQQEAVTYSSHGQSLYFTSEFDSKWGDKNSPLFKMQCQP